MFARIIKPKNKRPTRSESGDGEGSDVTTGSGMNRNAVRGSWSGVMNGSSVMNRNAVGASRSDVTSGSSDMNRNAAVFSRALAGSNTVRGSVPYTNAPPVPTDSAPPPRFLPGRQRTSLSETPYSNGAYSNGTDHLPSFQDVMISERPSLFLRKVNLCNVLFDFTQQSKNSREKEIKRQTLSELVDYVSTGTAKLDEKMVEECFKMISINIFRALPTARHDSSRALNSMEEDEEEPILEPAWSHLQLVYELLVRYVDSAETDPKVARQYVNRSFLVMLLELFDTEDPREREVLKTVLHRVYGKFMSHRPFIRKSINNIFYRFIFETERHNGVAELLEVLGSIINGFALPLKEEHKLFLVRALIPLHKPKSLTMYQQQLIYCVSQFVEKDFKLADTVIRGLLKYWPVTNSQKEVIFLGEVEEILELTQPAEFQRCMVILFKQLARCFNSLHFQVAERALFLWNNDHIVSLVAQNRSVILPIIFPALEKNTSHHWSLAVNGLTTNVRKMFQVQDEELFQECLKKYQEDEAKAKTAEEEREATWKRLELLANSRTA